MKHSSSNRWLLVTLVVSTWLLAACGLLDRSPAADASQADEIAAAVRTYLAAQGGGFDQFDIQVEEIEGGFARVQINSNDPAAPGGFTGFLQEVEGDWTTLLVGSGFNPVQVESLGIPQAILPDGWVLPAVATGADDKAGCPTAVAGSLAFANSPHGYCLLYPEGYVIEQPSDNETVLVVGSLMNHTDPRVSITVEPANGRTVAQAADASLATFGLPANEVDRTETTIGGQDAVMLDKLPGQDINRQLFIIHEDVLYHLFFTPFDEELADSYAQAQELFGQVTGSLVFQTPDGSSPITAEPGDPLARLYDSLTAAGGMGETGVSLENRGDQIEQPFFTPTGQFLKVNEAEIQVFTYESAEAADVEAALVAPDGGSIGTHMATWLATPHFYQFEQHIILYIGDDEEVLSVLETALGPQFAGGGDRNPVG